MKKAKPLFSYPVTGDLLRYLFLASAKTAKSKLRESFYNCVDTWLDSHDSDTGAVEERTSFLSSEKGTTLEPLVLDDMDVALATRFIRMAYSFGGIETGSEEAILIGSRDAIGSGGGVYFQKQRPPQFIERFPYGKDTPINERTWLFSPQYEAGAICGIDDDFISQIEEKVRWQNGALRVLGADSSALNWRGEERFLDDLKRHSSIGRNSEGFGRFGLSAEFENNCLIIKPDRPETMLRLSAMMAQDEVLILDPEGSPNGTRGALCIQLSEPEDDEFEFPATVHSRSNPISSWVSLPVLRTHPDVKKEIVDGLLAEFGNAVN